MPAFLDDSRSILKLNLYPSSRLPVLAEPFVNLFVDSNADLLHQWSERRISHTLCREAVQRHFPVYQYGGDQEGETVIGALARLGIPLLLGVALTATDLVPR